MPEGERQRSDEAPLRSRRLTIPYSCCTPAKRALGSLRSSEYGRFLRVPSKASLGDGGTGQSDSAGQLDATGLLNSSYPPRCSHLEGERDVNVAAARYRDGVIPLSRVLRRVE